MNKIILTQEEIAYALEHGYIDISKLDNIDIFQNIPEEEHEWWAREKSKQIRRYSRKQRHKNYLKLHYNRMNNLCGSFSDYGEYYHYYPYNHRSYLSGMRRVCKLQTNKKIRQLKSDELLLSPGDYRRLFDYWWTVY
jgi:hypothetical protein